MVIKLIRGNQTDDVLTVFIAGDPGIVLSTRRDSSCSLYHPPPPTDIEKMKNNMLKEQKVFALIREIVGKKCWLLRKSDPKWF